MAPETHHTIDAELQAEAIALSYQLSLIRIGFALVLMVLGNWRVYVLAADRPEIGFGAEALAMGGAVLYVLGSIAVAIATGKARTKPRPIPVGKRIQIAVTFMDIALLTVATVLPLRLLAEKGGVMPQSFVAVLYALPCMVHGMQLHLGRSRLLGAIFAAAGLGALYVLVPTSVPEGLSAIPPYGIAVASYFFIVTYCQTSVSRVRGLIIKLVARGVWRDRLARVLPADAITAIEKEGGFRLGGTKQDAAVLFTDIRGFTSMSERLDPTDVLEFLNEYFRAMVAVVFQHHGTLDKFIGDAVMASFTAPQGGAGAALACAKAMHERLALFNRDRVRAGKDPVKMVAAIHFGPVIAGWLGSEERPEYTMIGDTVNVAARLEGLAKSLSQDIVASEAALASIAVRPTWLRPMGAHDIKGRSDRLSVHGWSAAAPVQAAS